ncbi:MAG: LamG domain-containing protein [Myxococcota bacterium]
MHFRPPARVAGWKPIALVGAAVPLLLSPALTGCPDDADDGAGQRIINDDDGGTPTDTGDTTTGTEDTTGTSDTTGTTTSGGSVGAGGAGGDAEPDFPCRAADFDGAGNAVIAAPEDVVYEVAGDFTLEAWVKVEAAPGGPFAFIAGRVDDLLIETAYYIGINQNLEPFLNLSSAGGAESVNLVSSAAVSVGTWAHVAGVVDGTAMRLYVDGAERATGLALAPAGGNGFDIGHTSSGGGPYQLNGRLDEVRLSDTVRYNADFTPAPRFVGDANTLALFRFDDGANTVDSSPVGNDASVVGPGAIEFVADCPSN